MELGIKNIFMKSCNMVIKEGQTIKKVYTTDGKLLFSFDETKTTLAKKIGKHKDLRQADLKGENLAGANLAFANLEGADLENANLWGANLKGANLRWAYLGDADLEDANLHNADLSDAKLVSANLMYADLSGADIRGANLWGANFRSANLAGADFEKAILWRANLERAKNIPDIPFACPSEGSFIAWKKVGRNYLVKLEIPADARRSSATSNKCRCDKALVLDIEDLEYGGHPNKVVNRKFCVCVYEVGKMVYPDWFDEDRWNVCSHGIHFFMDMQDAVNYNIV